MKNCHCDEDTITKGTVLIPCSSLETAEMVSGSACMSPSGTAFTLKQPMQDHMRLECGEEFASCVSFDLEIDDHDDITEMKVSLINMQQHTIYLNLMLKSSFFSIAPTTSSSKAEVPQ